MNRFTIDRVKIVINDKSILGFFNHPNMGNVSILKLDEHSKFTTTLRAGEDAVRKLISERSIETDERIKNNPIFIKWWNKTN